MELTDNDRQRIEQEIDRINKDKLYVMQMSAVEKAYFRLGAEYATRYEREKFDPHLPCVKENKRDLEKLTKKLQEHKAQKLSSLEKYQLERIEKLEAERSEVKQQEIINNNIIEQLQIRVEQDIAKIKKLEDDAHDYSAWQSEYRASRAEVERLKAERSELRNKVIEQAIDICKDYEVGWQVADIIEKLNSLKTK